jgi:hypothetical protein
MIVDDRWSGIDNSGKFFFFSDKENLFDDDRWWGSKKTSEVPNSRVNMDHSCLRTHVTDQPIQGFNIRGICGVVWRSLPKFQSSEVPKS